jgi:hypothetical protein
MVKDVERGEKVRHMDLALETVVSDVDGGLVL